LQDHRAPSLAGPQSFTDVILNAIAKSLQRLPIDAIADFAVLGPHLTLEAEVPPCKIEVECRFVREDKCAGIAYLGHCGGASKL
jgi:hypothetical protein